MADQPLILTPGDTPDVMMMGGKAAALARLARHDLPVPPWVVLTPAAFWASLGEDRRTPLEQSDNDAERSAIAANASPSPGVLALLEQKMADAGLTAGPFAVRSSATQEDAAGHSFAGQFESYLSVSADQLAQRIAQVWQSAFSPRVLAYHREHGLSSCPQAPAVLIQQQVRADTAGVAFGADPITGRRQVAVVSAVYGLGTALVGGEADADTWRVDRDGRITERHIASKPTQHIASGDSREGVRSEPVAESMRDRPVLDDRQVQRIADLVRQTTRFGGRPQDIEWAFEGGDLWLLQSRPITSLSETPDPDGDVTLWDNANIAESYSGVTTPLTFSFARRAYEGVYREFCLILNVPRSTVDQHANTFRNMLGLIRGRVYYNLLNWYRVLALLPGFAFNRRFMEQMMGVREGLPESFLEQFQTTRRGAKAADGARLLAAAASLVWRHLTLGRSIRRFYRRLDAALAPPDPPLDRQRLDQLAQTYRQLESSLLTRWDAPLVNDFLSMIFFGVLARLTSRWGGEDADQLHNHLLCAEGGIVSAEPARLIREMAELAREDDALVASLCEDDAEPAQRRVSQHAALHTRFRQYIERFGDRCLEELKLESLTLADDPTPLLRSIGYAARRAPNDAEPGELDRRLRSEAESAMTLALRRRPLKRWIFRWVLRNARARVRDRENLRFERTRLFGRVRRIFLEMGAGLTAEGGLDQPRDVFFLEVEELIGFVEGTTTCTDLRGLVRVRATEFEGFADRPAPADRFETYGAVPIGNRFETDAPADDSPEGVDVLQGLGCCPGVVRGRVRVVTDPRGVELEAGSILAARRTDPGWIMLFPAAAGVLVEHGSLLSHSAIVARELGVPTIVAIPGLLQRLENGQEIEMDGRTGVVRLITDLPGQGGDANP